MKKIKCYEYNPHFYKRLVILVLNLRVSLALVEHLLLAPTRIRLDCKLLLVANTLAYHKVL